MYYTISHNIYEVKTMYMYEDFKILYINRKFIREAK